MNWIFKPNTPLKTCEACTMTVQSIKKDLSIVTSRRGYSSWHRSLRGSIFFSSLL
jgi:hypothetical protein